MKFLLTKFGGYKNFMATVAQSILAVFILPLLCSIIRYLLPDMAVTFCSSILGEASLFEVWLDLWINTADQASMTVHYTTYFEAMLAPVGKAMAESMLIGMCIYLCKTVGTMLCMRGVPVLQTVIGVFLGCITLGSMKTGDAEYTIVACAFLIRVYP